MTLNTPEFWIFACGLFVAGFLYLALTLVANARERDELAYEREHWTPTGTKHNPGTEGPYDYEQGIMSKRTSEDIHRLVRKAKTR